MFRKLIIKLMLLAFVFGVSITPAMALAMISRHLKTRCLFFALGLRPSQFLHVMYLSNTIHILPE
ncbi:MAG: hypothetical protein CO186_08110 [Zetaproteobacteria bacterium CG_4_9_14_3_um_filter_49_83]|nr:MAG: hypothetical protein AUJ56_08320 [Zetaproteobacteria bacterium CG1_02_49_23]PIQ34071.1 MAG: hypothetical protein COW62_03230 [Zetaproteobacteria bacterium CG17_big_fil_post_rev_8_21_14_2_50_50_13]PIV31491.1 MAG: hypothetical protein COS35_01110 [Zetaproteobacteria bacterium CG02_land_8_20_14_3_00_50_9]PIY55881.1 MAG: hypothetical protein COZ00_07110 [Zetaproteobacteria bacterium CG_4_10_14_0_8_um_filter_49_80]PJA35011.1 MAG: hypothetical protein CO186_08110 [Zetaproteobacteria bacterium